MKTAFELFESDKGIQTFGHLRSKMRLDERGLCSYSHSITVSVVEENGQQLHSLLLFPTIHKKEETNL